MDHVFLENALLVNISKFDFLTQTLVVDVLVAETSIHRVSIYSLYKHIYAFLIKIIIIIISYGEMCLIFPVQIKRFINK